MSALKRRAGLDAFRVALNDALQSLTHPGDIQREAARLLGEQLHADRVVCAHVIGDDYVVEGDWTSGAPSVIGRHSTSSFSRHDLAAFGEGRHAMSADVARDILISEDERTSYAAIDVAAYVAVPIVTRGVLSALLAATSARPRPWRPEEIELIQETAARLWVAVERARAEEALRRLNDELEARVRERTSEINQLLARLIAVQEEERRRIARDLHDDLGQTLTALRLNLEVLHLQAAAYPALAQHTERTQSLAKEIDERVDLLAWDLRPPSLDLGLEASLTTLVAVWSQRCGIAATTSILLTPDVHLPSAAELNLHRVTQEALHNVVKHAHATHVSVTLRVEDAELVLSIDDDGQGFELADAQGHIRSAGIVNMRERATLAGGRLELLSTPGAGTIVRVRVPLQDA